MFFLRFEFVIVLFQVFVDITSVISAGRGTVFAPLSEAEPAKAMLAFLADHVHATLILLD